MTQITTRANRMRMSAAEFRGLKKPSKYRNAPSEADGIRFASKLERDYYLRLKLHVATGAVRYFLRQVPIHMPGGVRYVCDFLEVHADWSIHYVDVKGVATPMFKAKKRIVEALYPITIELVKRI